MTVDIAHMNGNAIATMSNANEALARLGEWVTAAQQAHQLVTPLVDTPFVPDSYRPKFDPRATPDEKAAARSLAIANATAAVLQGITLGLDPLTALQQIYLVHGRPGMYAEVKVALVKSKGHEVWTEDISDTRAVVCGRRKGTDYVERVTVTMQQARTAGWTSNQAYTKTPQDMLYARAAARVCDRVAPDVLMGIASVEEIRDEIHATAEVGNGHRTVTPRKRAAAAAIEASVEGDPPLEEVVASRADEPTYPMEQVKAEVEAPAATGAQTRKLHALLRDKAMTNREAALRWMGEQLERDVDSTKTLTVEEASIVIDALEQLPAPVVEEPSLLDDEPS